MIIRKRLLEQYTVEALLPYLILSVLILTVSLLAQQTTKFAEIVGTARAPFPLALEILIDLLPNVLVFTLPMGMLIGTATGFSRMGSDSELIAMRAAGVGTARIVTPILLTGLLVSALTLAVGFGIAPTAAQNLRQTALQAALYKLESPVEPRSFYTDMPGKVVYVRDGNQDSGQWGRVFIYWQDRNEPARLVTARSGRIDSSGEQSELVLSDAMVTTLPSGEGGDTGKATQIMTERSAQLRIRDDRLDEGRRSLLQRLRERRLEFDEMGWQELSAQMSGAENAASRRNATVAFHRRLALGMAPLVFSLLGAAMCLRTRRGGRGLGILLSLAAMLSYYLLTLGGEQLGRAGILPIPIGVWLSNLVIFCSGMFLLLSGSRLIIMPARPIKNVSGLRKQGVLQVQWQKHRPSFLGLLDRSILRSLGWGFLGATTVLVAIFLIFTLFELLRFITANGTSLRLILRYMLFLLPFVTVSLFPMCMLVAVLTTYALMARRSEAVAWWSSGQSVYRLALPGLLFAASAGVCMWFIQENVMPQSNRRQNALRTQIREGVSRTEIVGGRQWLATTDTRKIYTFEFEEDRQQLKYPVVYEFDGEGVHLQRIIFGQVGQWYTPDKLSIEASKVLELSSGNNRRFLATMSVPIEEPQSAEMFKPLHSKPSEQSFKQLRDSLQMLKMRGGTDTVPLAVALERKRVDPLAPLVMAFIGIPMAIAFGKRNAVTALSLAVVIGLLFWAAASGFQQLGIVGLLPPTIAAWSPPLIFASIGLYLFSQSKT